MSTVDEPPEGRGRQRLLAALPLPPGRADEGQHPFQLDSRRRPDPAARLRRDGGPLRDARTASDPERAEHARATWPRPTSTSAGATTSSWPQIERTVPDLATTRGERDEPTMPDLTTTYLGLDLRSPLVASAGPLTRTTRLARRARGRTASAPSCCRRCSRSRSSTRRSDIDRDARRRRRAPSARRSTTSRARRLRRRPRPLPRRASSRPRPRRRAGHRQPQRRHRRRLGALRRRCSRRPAPMRSSSTSTRCTATRPGRPPRSRTPTSQLVEAVRAEVGIPRRREARPVLLGASHRSPCASTSAGVDGLVLFNRFYQPDLDLETLDVRPVGRAVVGVGAAAAAALDRDAPRAPRPARSPPPRASTTASTSPRRCWSAPTSR